MDPEARQALEDRENLDALVAAHLAHPALVREILEGHILGYTMACRGVDARGHCPCNDGEAEQPA